MQLSRRQALAAGAALAAPFPAGAADAGGLAAIARANGLLYGASIARDVFENVAYRDLYLRETAIVTTDYALKFDALRPHSPEADFTAADRLVDFARGAGLQVRGTALIWNEYLPSWVRRLSRREIERLFDRHIEETVSHFAGRLHSWDVVNEAIWPDHNAPRGFRRGPWYDAIGPSYVRHAFRRAAAFDPKARLTLNEAFCERNDRLGQTVRRRLLALIDDLLDDGAPLHAIGFQAHLQPQFEFSDAVFVDFLGQVAARGLDIYLTELDVDDSSFPEDIAARDREVAGRYGAFLNAALKVPAVKLVVNWQLSDGFSWYRDPAVMASLKMTRPPRPLPFDETLRRKPAWSAVAEAFARRGGA